MQQPINRELILLVLSHSFLEIILNDDTNNKTSQQLNTLNE